MSSATFSILAATDVGGICMQDAVNSTPPYNFSTVGSQAATGYFNPWTNGLGTGPFGNSAFDARSEVLAESSPGVMSLESTFLRWHTGISFTSGTVTAGTISFNLVSIFGSPLYIWGDWVTSGWNGGLPSAGDIPADGQLLGTAFQGTSILSTGIVTYNLLNLGTISPGGYTRMRIQAYLPPPGFPAMGGAPNAFAAVISTFADGIIANPSISLVWTPGPSLPPLCMPRP